MKLKDVVGKAKAGVSIEVLSESYLGETAIKVPFPVRSELSAVLGNEDIQEVIVKVGNRQGKIPKQGWIPRILLGALKAPGDFVQVLWRDIDGTLYSSLYNVPKGGDTVIISKLSTVAKGRSEVSSRAATGKSLSEAGGKWFRLGDKLNGMYNKIARSSSSTLRPKKEVLQQVAKQAGLKLGDVTAALMVYNAADPIDAEKEVTRPFPETQE